MPVTTSPIDPPASLTTRWRDALARGLQLDTGRLQLATGETALGTGLRADVECTWRFFEALPTDAPVRRWAAAATADLAGSYGAVIHNLLPQHDAGLRVVLGSRSASWRDYRSDPDHLPLRLPTLADGQMDVPGVLIQMFQTWGVGQLDGTQLRAGVALLRGADPVASATARFAAAGSRRAWTTTVDAPVRPLTVRLDATAGWTVGAHFDVVRCVSGRPLSPGDRSAHGDIAWFDPATLALARAHDDDAVWRRRSPSWEQTFGDHGSLRRLITAVVVVDGISLTVTAPAAIDDVDREWWPSFAADGCGEGRRLHGGETVRWASPLGHPQVLATVVTPIEHILRATVGGGARRPVPDDALAA